MTAHHPSHIDQSPTLAGVDFDRTPFVAIWETTRACDLACKHCRAEAIPDPLPGQLTTEEGFGVLDELAQMKTPICVLSGGDPAKRSDLVQLVRYGHELGMRMATIPAATPLLTRQLLCDLKEAGLAQLALSLDGPTADLHDGFRTTPGAFDHTIRGAALAREVGLPLQINTTLTAASWPYFDRMTELVSSLGVVFWEVFFLVPMGRGSALQQLNGEQYERLFERLSRFAGTADFIVKVTEAPHYRRYLMQRQSAGQPSTNGKPGSGGRERRGPGALPGHMRRDFGPGGSIGLAPKGVNAGKGHLFISHCGEIFPRIACWIRGTPSESMRPPHPG